MVTRRADGTPMLFGRDLDAIVAEHLADPAMKEILKQAQKNQLLYDIYTIWSGGVERLRGTLKLDMIFNTEKDLDKLQTEGMRHIENAMQNAADPTKFSMHADQFFSMVVRYEKGMTGGWGNMALGNSVVSGMDKIQKLFNETDESNLATKRVAILDLMRKKTADVQIGNSPQVRIRTQELLLSQPSFAIEKEIVSNDDIYERILGGSGSDADKVTALIALHIPKEIAQTLPVEWKKIVDGQDAHREYMRTQLQKKYPNLTGTAYESKTSEEFLAARKVSMRAIITDRLLYARFDADKSLYESATATPEAKLYADIQSVKTYGVLSDEGVEGFIRAGIDTTLALGTMAAGGLVLRGAGALAETALAGRVGTSVRGVVAASPRLSAIAGSRGLSIATKGLIFYEGSNFAKNAIFQRSYKNLGNEAANLGEIIKSVAFFGVAAGIQKVFDLRTVQNMAGRVPDSVLNQTKTIVTGLIAAEAGVQVGVNVALTAVLTPEQYRGFTWEEYIQALMMVVITKGAVASRGAERPVVPRDNGGESFGPNISPRDALIMRRDALNREATKVANEKPADAQARLDRINQEVRDAESDIRNLESPTNPIGQPMGAVQAGAQRATAAAAAGAQRATAAAAAGAQGARDRMTGRKDKAAEDDGPTAEARRTEEARAAEARRTEEARAAEARRTEEAKAAEARRQEAIDKARESANKAREAGKKADAEIAARRAAEQKAAEQKAAAEKAAAEKAAAEKAAAEKAA
jgi:hypothetical protein